MNRVKHEDEFSLKRFSWFSCIPSHYTFFTHHCNSSSYSPFTVFRSVKVTQRDMLLVFLVLETSALLQIVSSTGCKLNILYFNSTQFAAVKQICWKTIFCAQNKQTNFGKLGNFGNFQITLVPCDLFFLFFFPKLVYSGDFHSVHKKKFVIFLFFQRNLKSLCAWKTFISILIGPIQQNHPITITIELYYSRKLLTLCSIFFLTRI